jgi:hypothetical protein
MTSAQLGFKYVIALLSLGNILRTEIRSVILLRQRNKDWHRMKYLSYYRVWQITGKVTLNIVTFMGPGASNTGSLWLRTKELNTTILAENGITMLYQLLTPTQLQWEMRILFILIRSELRVLIKYTISTTDSSYSEPNDNDTSYFLKISQKTICWKPVFNSLRATREISHLSTDHSGLDLIYCLEISERYVCRHLLVVKAKYPLLSTT